MKRNRNFKLDRSSPGSSDKGAVLVEFALVLPVFMILLLPIIDLGLAIRDFQVIQNGAREGAHFSALPLNQISPLNPMASEDRIKERVIDYCQGENISLDPASITINQQYFIDTGEIIVRASEINVRYDHQLLFVGALFVPDGKVTLVGRAVFRNQY